MKQLLFTLMAAIAMLTSCKPALYFQMYEAKSVGQTVSTENGFLYEDANCKVTYNLWGEGGNIGFLFTNKTDENLVVDLSECFFVINGMAHDYFLNRQYTHSSSRTENNVASTSYSQRGLFGYGLPGNQVVLAGVGTVAASNGIGRSVTSGEVVVEKEKVVVPAHSSKYFSEYRISTGVYRDCELMKYPTKRHPSSVSFSQENSPLVFSNRIAYTKGDSKDLVRFENEFYVSAIENKPKDEVVEFRQEEFCGEKESRYADFFKTVSGKKFYISYKRISSKLKH